MIALADFKKALGTLNEELSEEEILKLRENQDKMAEVFFDLWLKTTNKIGKKDV